MGLTCMQQLLCALQRQLSHSFEQQLLCTLQQLSYPFEFVQVCHGLLDSLADVIAIQEQCTLCVLNLPQEWNT